MLVFLNLKEYYFLLWHSPKKLAKRPKNLKSMEPLYMFDTPTFVATNKFGIWANQFHQKQVCGKINYLYHLMKVFLNCYDGDHSVTEKVLFWILLIDSCFIFSLHVVVYVVKELFCSLNLSCKIISILMSFCAFMLLNLGCNC